MSLEAGSERDLVVLNHEYRRHVLHRGEVHALVACGRLRGPVAHPGESDPRLAAVPKRQSDTGDDHHARPHVADGLDDPRGQVTDMKIPSAAGRVGCGQVSSEHVGQRHAHHMERAGVPDHRTNHVDIGVERPHGAYRHGLLTRPEPGFRDDARVHPALQADVVQARSEEIIVEREQIVLGETRYDLGLSRVGLERELKGLDEPRIRDPVDVLGAGRTPGIASWRERYSERRREGMSARDRRRPPAHERSGGARRVSMARRSSPPG